MANILVIQFRSDARALELEERAIRRVLADTNVDVMCKNALEGEIDWSVPKSEVTGYSGVVLAGSGELYFDGGHAEEHEGRVITSRIAREAKPFAEYLLEHEIPTLGICFGHQLLGYAAGVNVGHSVVESKTGTQTVELTDEGALDPLFAGLPRTFPAQYAHKDVLFDLPQGATILARNSDWCRFSALRYSPKMYSVQFHPERRKEDLIMSLSWFPEYLPSGVKPEDVFAETKESERVMKNFAAMI